GNAERQESAGPVESLRGVKPDQADKEIPILEDEKQNDGLYHANPAEPGFRFVKPAGKGFPQEDSEAGGGNQAPQGGEGEKKKKKAAADDDDPRAEAGRSQTKECRAGNQKEEIVSPGVEDHPI